MPNENFIKNITSKDVNISKNTISNMINSASIECFKELCEKSDFIFPFLKERIIKDFVKLINKENLKTVFEFSKIYCFDFENLILNSWLKFADEDLTDEILEIFEKGTDEQKAYCALYFCHIKDSLALELLNKYSYSNFEPLKINCAQALSAFGDKNVYEDMKKIILNSNDDFEKTSAFLFMSAYKGDDAINFIIDNCFNNPFKIQIISNLLDFNGFESLKNLHQDKIIQIFLTLIEGYPEDIGLETIEYYKILDFAKLINSYNTQFAKNALLIAHEKFAEFFENDIYQYDLDKNSKHYLKEINVFLSSLSLDTENLNEELKQYNTIRYEAALNVVEQLKPDEFKKTLSYDLEFLNEEYIAKTVLVLKKLNASELIPLSILDKIQNENIKALVKSCM